MELLNQPVKIVPNSDDTVYSIVNTINGQELARISSNEPMNLWLNKGWFMTKEESDNFYLSKLKVDEEVFEAIENIEKETING